MLKLILLCLIILTGCARADKTAISGIVPAGGPKAESPSEKAEPNQAQPAKPAVAPKPDQTIALLKEELGPGFIVDYSAPFAIAGNIPADEFERIKDGTIKHCAEALYKDYFTKKPDYILKVYLFKDAETYESYCRKTDGRKPSTPYGFYQHASRSLIMNIGTGTGTLVHEMVHALMEPDFPDVPAWFNEGLGSLYEQCRIEDDGSLKGLINWRYKGLMQASRDKKLLPLKKLLATSTNEFYGAGSDVHYAQARYFCLYLQEHKLLAKFYKQFHDNFDDDKTGIKFAEKLLDKTIEEIDADWRNWIVRVKDINSLK